MSDLEPFAATIARLVAQRVQTRAFLPDGLISDPIWDAMLDLAHSEVLGRKVAISEMSYAMKVPLTTALRHIGIMQDSGLVQRAPSRTDKRRHWLALTESGRAAMVQTLAAIKARESEHADA